MAFVACSNKEELSKVHGDLYSDKIALEKMFRDECEKVLLAEQKKRNLPREERYVQWEKKHSLTKTPPRAVDKILVDESVGHLLSAYFLENGCSSNAIFKTLEQCDNSTGGFFSRKETTDSYSDIAIEDFGFPSGKSSSAAEDGTDDNRSVDDLHANAN